MPIGNTTVERQLGFGMKFNTRRKNSPTTHRSGNGSAGPSATGESAYQNRPGLRMLRTVGARDTLDESARRPYPADSARLTFTP